MAYLTEQELIDAIGTAAGVPDTAIVKRSISFAATLINGYLGWDPTDTSLDRVYTTVAESYSRSLQLPMWPVEQVVSISANNEQVLGEQEDPSNGWWLDKTHGIIEELNLPGIGIRGGRYGHRISVVYRAGYDPVPQVLKDVALNLAMAIYGNGGDVSSPTGGGGTGELKSLTMFDAMSMSFDVGGASSSDAATGPQGMVETWAFVLDTYKIRSPALA